jgi:hypothetical protein
MQVVYPNPDQGILELEVNIAHNSSHLADVVAKMAQVIQKPRHQSDRP